MRGQNLLSHGAFSAHVRKRFSDGRSSDGRRLNAVIRGIVQDLGGEENISASQRLILDGLKSKLVVILQISSYVDKQLSLVDTTGNVIPCLKQTLISYQAEMRRDLELLHGMDRRSKKPGGGLAEWIKENATK